MADTDFGALSTSQKRVYSAEVWKNAVDASFWFVGGFVGKSESSIITLVTELTKTERGDKCLMPLVQELAGDGVAGDNDRDGNEEQLVNEDLEIKIDLLWNGVKNKGKMSEQRTVIRFRTTAREKLSTWLTQKMDELGFLTMAGRAYTLKLNGATRAADSQLSGLAFAADVSAPSTNRKLFAGSATSTATLTASDKMTWDLVVKARSMAQRKRLKPARINGKEYYGLVMSTEQGRDLRQSSDYKTIVAQAETRGSDNPLFKAAFAVVDGVMLFAHNKTPTTIGAASGSKYGAAGTVEGAQGLLVGGQSLAMAKVGNMEWTESKNDDHGNKKSAGIETMFGVRKPVFQSEPDGNTTEDFGVISVYTAAAA